MGQTRLSRKKRTIYGAANREDRRFIPDPEEFSQLELLEIRRQRSEALANSEALRPEEWPELSISRPVNLGVDAADRLVRFIDDVENRNGHRGTVRTLGLMGCEFVGPAAAQRMFTNMYPKAVGEKHRALRLLRDFAKGFNIFMREREKAVADERFVAAAGVILGASDLPVLDKPEDHMLEFDSRKDWLDDDKRLDASEGLFAVTAIERYGSELGLNLDSNEQLHSEWTDIQTYLRRDGLDTRLMDGTNSKFKFEPQVPFYAPRTTGGVLLTYTVEIPQFLSLHPPAAHVKTS